MTVKRLTGLAKNVHLRLLNSNASYRWNYRLYGGDETAKVAWSSRRYLKDVNYFNAIQVYTEIANKYPNSKYAAQANERLPYIYMEQGKNYIKNNAFDKAKESYDVILENYTDSALNTEELPKAYLDLGVHYINSNQFSKGRVVFDFLQTKFPNSQASINSLPNYYLELGKKYSKKRNGTIALMRIGICYSNIRIPQQQ